MLALLGLCLSCLTLGFLSGQSWLSHRPRPTETPPDEGLDRLNSRQRHQLLHNVLAFYDTRAAEVMTIRSSMVAFADQTPLAEAIPQMLSSGFSRFPVYAEHIDSIQGLVHLKELLRAQQHAPHSKARLADFICPTLFVPKDKPVLTLLEKMQAERIRLVIVADAHGGTEGLLTLNDLVYEVFGDWSDPQIPLIQPLSGQCFCVQGQTDLDTLQRELKLKLPVGAYQTLAGFVLKELGHIPQVGESLIYQGWILRVTQMAGLRIQELELQRDKRSKDTLPLKHADLD